MIAFMAHTLGDLVQADKRLAEVTEWSLVGRRLELKLPLEIEGLIYEQFFFRASALEHLPDQLVTYQLEYHGVDIAGGTGPLCRLEWRPKGVHNNRGRGPDELKFTDQRGSHFHSFSDNWDPEAGALLKDNLPIARPLEPEPETFEESLLLAGALFRVSNIGLIKPPEWSWELGLQ